MDSPFFLRPKWADEASDAFVLPGIMNAMEQKHIKRPCLHVLTLNPTVPYSPDTPLPILFERSINRGAWEKPYHSFAEGKARISWRTGLTSREVVLCKPHLLLPGDIRFWGSAIVNGIISAASAVESCFDEMFAGMASYAMCGEASYYAQQHAATENPGLPAFLSG